MMKEEQRHERYVNPYTEESLKHYGDLRNTIASAERRGREEGREEGRKEGRKEGLVEGIQREKAETVNRLHSMGLAVEKIAQGANLTVEQVMELLKQLRTQH